VTLNSTVVSVRWGRLRRIELVSVSAATHSAPAPGPKRSAAGIVSASDGEKLTGNPGSRTIANPEAQVMTSNTSQVTPGGCWITSATDAARTVIPAETTVTKKSVRRLFARRPGTWRSAVTLMDFAAEADPRRSLYAGAGASAGGSAPDCMESAASRNREGQPIQFESGIDLARLMLRRGPTRPPPLWK
jgi:hypothetical protein